MDQPQDIAEQPTPRADRGRLDGIASWIRVLEIVPEGFAPARDLLLRCLLERYPAARIEADAAARYRSGDEPTGICRYCGKYRPAFTGSQIDGHARCLVPIVFQRRMNEVLGGPGGPTMTAVASALGVSLAVLRAWYRNPLAQAERRTRVA